MANEFNVAKVIEDTARSLKGAGMPAEEAKRQAAEQVNSMGATKTLQGDCPIGGASPLACDEAKCSHYQAELEAEGETFELDEDQARLFEE